MDITVNVDSIDLNEHIGSHYDEDGDRIPGGTLGDLIAGRLVDKGSRDGTWKGVIERVQAIRDEEIRTQLAPVIAEALAKPIKRTNSYGEATGAETTLREVIVDEARKWMNAKADDRYGSNNSATNLQKMIRDAVRDAFTNEIADAVKAAREAVTTRIGEDIGERISGVVREALTQR